MYKLLLLEDDQKAADSLIEYLNRFASEKGFAIETRHFDNPFDLLESYRGGVDAIFFDIEMPMMNGMEAARKIRDMDPNVTIVFVTNLAQFAIEGYAVKAFDFILKPLNYPSLEMKFARLFNEISHNEKGEMISVKGKGSMQIFPLSEIRYVEIKNHSLIYHLVGKDVSAWESLTSASEKLLPHHFAFSSASYLVNLAFVEGISGNEVNVGGEKLPISKGKRKSFLSELALYYGGSK